MPDLSNLSIYFVVIGALLMFGAALVAIMIIRGDE